MGKWGWGSPSSSSSSSDGPEDTDSRAARSAAADGPEDTDIAVPPPDTAACTAMGKWGWGSPSSSSSSSDGPEDTDIAVVLPPPDRGADNTDPPPPLPAPTPSTAPPFPVTVAVPPTTSASSSTPTVACTAAPRTPGILEPAAPPAAAATPAPTMKRRSDVLIMSRGVTMEVGLYSREVTTASRRKWCRLSKSDGARQVGQFTRCKLWLCSVYQPTAQSRHSSCALLREPEH